MLWTHSHQAHWCVRSAAEHRPTLTQTQTRAISALGKDFWFIHYIQIRSRFIRFCCARAVAGAQVNAKWRKWKRRRRNNIDKPGEQIRTNIKYFRVNAGSKYSTNTDSHTRHATPRHAWNDLDTIASKGITTWTQSIHKVQPVCDTYFLWFWKTHARSLLALWLRLRTVSLCGLRN